MTIHLDVSHAVLPHLAGSFAFAKSGNGGNAGRNGAGNHGGGESGRGGNDRGGAGNHGEGSSHGNGGGQSRGGHGSSGRSAGSANKDTSPGVSDVSPNRTGATQRRAAGPYRVLHGPTQGPLSTPVAKARDVRIKQQRAKHSLVATGLTDADLVKLTARGFRIQAQTRGSLFPRTVRLRPPYGLSAHQAWRAVHKINPKAVVDFNSYYFTEGETPKGFLTEPPDKSNRRQ